MGSDQCALVLVMSVTPALSGAATSNWRTSVLSIPAFGELAHHIALELVTEIWLPLHRLMSSKLGKKASKNLGAIHIHTRYDRCAHTFMSAICIAATVIFWLNQ